MGYAFHPTTFFQLGVYYNVSGNRQGKHSPKKRGSLCHHANKGLVSKETMVLRWWGSGTQNLGLIN